MGYLEQAKDAGYLGDEAEEIAAFLEYRERIEYERYLREHEEAKIQAAIEQEQLNEEEGKLAERTNAAPC